MHVDGVSAGMRKFWMSFEVVKRLCWSVCGEYEKVLDMNFEVLRDCSGV